MASATQFTISQLSRLIGTPGCPILIDICIDEDFAADPRLIPGAFRHPFTEIENLALTLKDKKVLIICQKGLKLSQGAAAVLRCEGIDANFLAGGNLAWRDANQPLVPAASIPERNQQNQTTWVAGHDPKVDTIACCWLVKRFIDSKARFLFVSPSEVSLVAERYGGTALGMQTPNSTHHDESNTFRKMLTKFHLETRPLLKMATIIQRRNLGQSGQLSVEPDFTDLYRGLSGMFSDDLAQMQANLVIHDALYHWARDVTEETDSSSTSTIEE